MACPNTPPEDFEPDMDGDDLGQDDDFNEPVGSCDNCECNLYADDEWDGLCNACYWLSRQGGEG